MKDRRIVVIDGQGGNIGRQLVKTILITRLSPEAAEIVQKEIDLNSCASGVSVVNIDNGFGAGYLASMINHIGKKE